MILFYQPQQDPTVGQISEKDVQGFLDLVAEFYKRTKLTLFFKKRHKQHTTERQNW